MGGATGADEALAQILAAASKLEGYAARLALVLYLAKTAATDEWATGPEVIDADSMTAGVTLAKWFVSETARVYRILEESDTETEQRQLIELIQCRGGRITANDLQRRSRKIDGTQKAETFFQGLADAGIGYWEDAAPATQGGGLHVNSC